LCTLDCLCSGKKLCPRRSLRCFFQPLSPCDDAIDAAHHDALTKRRPGLGSAAAAVGTETEAGGGGASLHASGAVLGVEVLGAAGSWVRSLSRERLEAQGAVHPRGWFWWTTALVAYTMRPSDELARQLEMAMSSTGLAAALASAAPVVGLHVRHGDACQQDGERTRRRCEPLKRYVAAIERLTDGLNATTVYLATDSEALLAEALRDYPQYRWLHYPPSLALGRSLNPTDRKWETRLRLDCRHSITVSQGPE